MRVVVGLVAVVFVLLLSMQLDKQHELDKQIHRTYLITVTIVKASHHFAPVMDTKYRVVFPRPATTIINN